MVKTNQQAVKAVAVSAADLEEALDLFKVSYEEAKAGEMPKKEIPQIFKRVEFDYVVITEVSKKGNNYLRVYELGNPKRGIGFASIDWKRESDGSYTDKINGFDLMVTEYYDGLLKDGLEVVSRKGFKFTVKESVSKKGNKYFALVDSETEAFKGYADQNRSQFSITFKVAVGA